MPETLQSLDKMSPQQEAAFLKRFERDIGAATDAVVAEHLAAGRPVVFDSPDIAEDCVIRKYPNGRLELVQVTPEGDRVIDSDYRS